MPYDGSNLLWRYKARTIAGFKLWCVTSYNLINLHLYFANSCYADARIPDELWTLLKIQAYISQVKSFKPKLTTEASMYVLNIS